MKLILKIIGLIFLAVAALHGFIAVNLPIEFGWAGLLCWFAADLVG